MVPEPVVWLACSFFFSSGVLGNRVALPILSPPCLDCCFRIAFEGVWFTNITLYSKESSRDAYAEVDVWLHKNG